MFEGFYREEEPHNVFSNLLVIKELSYPFSVPKIQSQPWEQLLDHLLDRLVLLDQKNLNFHGNVALCTYFGAKRYPFGFLELD